MSTPDRTRPQPPSAAARYAVVFVIGMVTGLFALVVVLRAIEGQRTWEDHYPRAVMQLYQAQMAQLSAHRSAGRCASSTSLAHLQTMRALSNDLERAFPDLSDHRGFVAHAAQTQQTLDAALSKPPDTCDALESTQGAVEATCRDCHRDFRG